MIRRYAPMKPSRGTVIPPKMRLEVYDRDAGCVGTRVGMPGDCGGQLEPDHVRASHGISMKSDTEVWNLVSLCSLHHRMKTEAGRTWRPILLADIPALAFGYHPQLQSGFERARAAVLRLLQAPDPLEGRTDG